MSRRSHGKEEILRAALELFAERGFKGSTTAAIARKAGVTQPLVHHHFGSKDGLWSAVLTEAFGDLAHALAEAAPPEPHSSVERLRRLLGTLVEFIGTHPEMGRLIRSESVSGGPAYDALYDAGLGSLIQLFHHEFQAAVEAKVIRDLPPAMAYTLVIGACTHPFSEGRTLQRGFEVDVTDPAFIASYRELVLDLLLSGLAPE